VQGLCLQRVLQYIYGEDVDDFELSDLVIETAASCRTVQTRAATGGGGTITIDRNIVKGVSGTFYGIGPYITLGTIVVTNNIVYGCGSGADSWYGGFIFASIAGQTEYIYNNTAIDNYRNFQQWTIAPNASTVEARNNIAKDDTGGGDFADRGAGWDVFQYNVTNDLTSETSVGLTHASGNTTADESFSLVDSGADFSTVVVGNIVEDSTGNYTYVTDISDSPTSLGLNDDDFALNEQYYVYTNVFGTPSFVDESNYDLHLNSGDTVALNKGENLGATGYIDDDIDADSRPSVWDIGADEWVGATTTTTVIIPTGAIRTHIGIIRRQ
jgi:hypothetical protein